MIPEQHTAYHHLTISHTGDKLKLGRQIAWKLVALWKHISSLVVFCGQVLVALVILRTSLVVIVVCVCSVVVSVQQQTQEPPQEVLVVVMSCKFGGHLVQRK